MTLEQAANWAQIIEGVTVVLSLLFIAWQVAESTRLAKAENVRSLVELSTPFNLKLIEDEHFAKLWLKSNHDYEEMTEIEQLQYEELISWWMILHENIFYQRQKRLIDQDVYSTWNGLLRSFIEAHHLEDFWQASRKNFNMDFADHVTKIIEDIKRERDASRA